MKKNRLKKYIILSINWILLLLIPVFLVTTKFEKNTIKEKIYPKKLSTSLIKNSKEDNTVLVTEIEKEDITSEVETTEDEEITKEIVSKNDDNKIEEKNDTEVKNTIINEPVVEEVKEQIYATYTGTMSFYNANCTSCSGITYTGVDVSDGRLYYYDNEYQNVRIIAAGSEIPKWSIVRIKNSSLGSSVLAIVLDRGSAVGVGKTHLIDMLTNNSENKTGINRNVTVEVLRNGK